MEEETRRWLLLIGVGSWLLATILISGAVMVLGSDVDDVAAVGGIDSADPLSFATAPTPSLSVLPKSRRSAESPRSTDPRSRQGGPITLSASPRRAQSSESITLEGSYPGGDGSTVRVQRQQGRWTDFPVSTAVQGGSFRTFVETGRSGRNRFRVVDPSTGQRSNVVSVMIGR